MPYNYIYIVGISRTYCTGIYLVPYIRRGAVGSTRSLLPLFARHVEGWAWSLSVWKERSALIFASGIVGEFLDAIEHWRAAELLLLALNPTHICNLRCILAAFVCWFNSGVLCMNRSHLAIKGPLSKHVLA